jgi:hypothetical protein
MLQARENIVENNTSRLKRKDSQQVFRYGGSLVPEVLTDKASLRLSQSVWLNGSLPGEGGTGRPEKAG